jgi:pentose-5-phosphate-3-epimerase
MDIMPSVLEPTSEAFIMQVERLSSVFKMFQVDIADGKLVPNKTQTLDDALEVIPKIHHVKELTFDFHLMVEDYLTHLTLLEKAASQINIRFVLIHHKAHPHPSLFETKGYPFSLGLVLNPEDNVETIKHHYHLRMIPVIQIMTINPGAQGTPFLPYMINVIEQLRHADYRGKIFIDGAVNDTTLPHFLDKEYKPDTVCPGSYFTKTQDPQKQLNTLLSLLRE